MPPKTLQQMYATGQRILTAARVGKLLSKKLGVTIIVHDAELGTYRPQAIVTTLPTRSHQRIVVADALLNMAMAEGMHALSAADLVDRDMKALEAGELEAGQSDKEEPS